MKAWRGSARRSREKDPNRRLKGEDGLRKPSLKGTWADLRSSQAATTPYNKFHNPRKGKKKNKKGGGKGKYRCTGRRITNTCHGIWTRKGLENNIKVVLRKRGGENRREELMTSNRTNLLHWTCCRRCGGSIGRVIGGGGTCKILQKKELSWGELGSKSSRQLSGSEGVLYP